MAILYSLVSRGNTILADHRTCNGNFKEVAQLVIADIPPQKEKKTYFRGNYFFHYICEDGIIFMCITDKEFDKVPAFLFLSEVQETFQSKYGYNAYSAEGFDTILASGMKHYSEKLDLSHISKVQDDVDDVKNILNRDIEKLENRGSELDKVLATTNRISLRAEDFNRHTTLIRQRQFWKNVKFWIIIGLVITVIAYCVVSMACGGLLWKKCI